MSASSLHRTKPFSHAFTLIELLVAISVVMLLLALLMPALRGARETARSAVCLNNQRQIGVLAHAYFVDFRSAFPVSYNRRSSPGVGGSMYDPRAEFAAAAVVATWAGHWPDWPADHQGGLLPDPHAFINAKKPGFFRCPKGIENVAGITGFAGGYLTSYGFNSIPWSAPMRSPTQVTTGRGAKLANIPQPSQKLYAADWPSRQIEHLPSVSNLPDHHWRSFVPGAGSNGVVGAIFSIDWRQPFGKDFLYGRHGLATVTTVNVLLVDGHAKSLSSAVVTQAHHFPTFVSPNVLTPGNMFNILKP